MGARLLVVDDERQVVEALHHDLQDAGYEVLTAHSGMEALNKARSALPDLILLDLMLEDLDGLSVCEILRCQPSTQSIPILMLTALAGEMLPGQGADDYLAKPISSTELRTRVEQLLQLQAARLQSHSLEAEPAG